MEKGAAILVKICAGIQGHEKVLIVTDERRKPIARAVEKAAAATGARVSLVTRAPSHLDNQEPEPAVAEQMRKARVIFLIVTHALAHTRATRSALELGAKVVSMSAFTERQMKEGGLFADFAARKPICDGLAASLSQAAHVRVENPAGTSLEFSIVGRQGNSHCCLLDKPGFTAVPNIEANISPVEGTCQGLLVVDGSIPYYEIGVIREAIFCRIKDGFVVEIEGGKQAEFLKSLLARQHDRYVYNIAQFAIGLNPECREFTGEMLNDEGVNRTIHIGIGTSANLGGTVQAKTHFDAIIQSPTVWLDRDRLEIPM